MSGRLAGRVAVVTGAATGIGAAIARGFAAEGARVHLLDVDEERGGRAASSLVADGFDAAFAACDVTDEEAVGRTFDAVAAASEGVHVLVNNAGGSPRLPIEAMDAGTWRSILDLNLTSVHLCVRAALPSLRAVRSSCVINLASLNADTTVPGLTAYAAAKGGVASLTRALAVELAPDVRVNAIVPGLVETDGWAEAVGDVETARAHRLPYHPLGRLGRPEDIVGCATYLASDEASFVTGAIVPVTGGLGLQLYARERP